MIIEQTETKIGISLEELESLINQKEPRLPKSIRAHIRSLKAAGQWEEAMRVAKEVREEKLQSRQQKAEVELNRTIRKIIETNDPQVQAVEEIRAIWLLYATYFYATGIIDSDERSSELLQTLDSKSPNLSAFLEGRMADIRDELQPLLPTAKELSTRGIRRS